MKCLVFFFSLTIVFASSIFAEDLDQKSKTVSLWDQEQNRLRDKIEDLQKQLKTAEALLQERIANREQFEKQNEIAENPMVSKTADQSATHKEEPARRKFEFVTPPTWKEFFAKISEVYNVEVEADEFPPGRIDLQGIKSLDDDAGIIWLDKELRKNSFLIWLLGNKVRLVRQPPRRHPLLGLWETRQIFEEGQLSDERIMILFTRRFGITFQDAETETFYYTLTPNESGLNPEMDLYFPEEPTFLKASFKVNEDHAEILWGEVTEEGLPSGQMIFMKLQRIE